MILIVSKEERELISRLRTLGPLSAHPLRTEYEAQWDAANNRHTARVSFKAGEVIDQPRALPPTDPADVALAWLRRRVEEICWHGDV